MSIATPLHSVLRRGRRNLTIVSEGEDRCNSAGPFGPASWSTECACLGAMRGGLLRRVDLDRGERLHLRGELRGAGGILSDAEEIRDDVGCLLFRQRAGRARGHRRVRLL